MIRVHINFYLNRSTKTKTEKKPVYCYVRSNTNTLALNTNIDIEEKYWSVRKQRAYPRYSGSFELNNYLDKFEERIKQIINQEFASNLDVSFNELKQRLIDNIREPGNKKFFDVYDEFLDIQSKKISVGTLKIFKTLRNHLTAFSESNSVTFSDIDLLFFDKFRIYLQDNGCNNNYQKKMLQMLKQFMIWSFQRKFHRNTKYQEFKNLTRETIETIALSFEELKQLKEVELSNSLDKIRDCFLFQVYTGQRYSDLKAFNINDIEKNVWKLTQQKTKKTVYIPLIPEAIAILQKYNYQLPLLSNQKMNLHLKEICRIAGIVVKVKSKDDDGNIIYIEKYKLVSTHTARRTFVSLSAYKGLQNNIIKQITGHSSDKMVNQYFKNDMLETSKLIKSVFTN